MQSKFHAELLSFACSKVRFSHEFHMPFCIENVWLVGWLVGCSNFLVTKKLLQPNKPTSQPTKLLVPCVLYCRKTVAIILCCSLGIPLVITAVCIGVCLWLKRRRRAACPALVEARNRESQDQLAAISFCSAMERHQTTTPGMLKRRLVLV